MTIIYHNPRCSTSRNTLQRLRDAGHEPEIIEYLKTPLNRDELARLISKAGLTPCEAIRTKEAVYTELGLEQADDDALLAAMEAHPVLLNRPFVVTDKGARLCRPIEAVDDIL